MATDPLNPPLALSRKIAGLIGPMLLALALSIVLNGGLVAEISHEIRNDIGLIMISGVLLLVAGIAILQVHRTWSGWQAAVTLCGWLSVVSGLIRMTLPTHLAKIAASIGESPALPLVSTAICSLLGAFLSYKAYLETDPKQ